MPVRRDSCGSRGHHRQADLETELVHIIDSALKAANQDQVRKILEKFIVKEDEFVEKSETKGVHVVEYRLLHTLLF